MDIAKEYVKKPYEAFLHYANLETKNYKYPQIHLVDTFNTSHEGDITVANATFSTAHDAASGTFNVNSGQCICSTGFTIARYGADFDTTALPNDATISAATIRIFFVSTNASNTDSTNFDIV